MARRIGRPNYNPGRFRPTPAAPSAPPTPGGPSRGAPAGGSLLRGAALVLAVIAGLGYLEQLGDSSEPQQSAEVHSTSDHIEAGDTDVVEAVLEENLSPDHPYRIEVDGAYVPIALSDAQDLVGERLRIHREFTGEGKRFRITRYEVVER